MKTIYKTCENCNGKGYFPQSMPQYSTLPPNCYPNYIVISEESKCHVCNGTGKVIFAWLDEIS